MKNKQSNSHNIHHSQPVQKKQSTSIHPLPQSDQIAKEVKCNYRQKQPTPEIKVTYHLPQETGDALQETNTMANLCLTHDLVNMEYFNNCLVGITWIAEDTDSLQEKLASAGLWDLEIISITKRKYLIKCDKEDHARMIGDITLNTWFKEVRTIADEDKILPRKAWIQIAGIPWTSISCASVQVIAEKWGDFEDWNDPIFGNNEMKIPNICISTMHMEVIQHRLRIEVNGVMYKIYVKEVVPTMWDFRHPKVVENTNTVFKSDVLPHNSHDSLNHYSSFCSSQIWFWNLLQLLIMLLSLPTILMPSQIMWWSSLSLHLKHSEVFLLCLVRFSCSSAVFISMWLSSVFFSPWFFSRMYSQGFAFLSN